MYRTAYLVGVLLFGLLWAYIFISRKDLRKEMLLLSLVVAGSGLTEPFFFGEYWSPDFLVNLGNLNFGIEDVLLMFFQGGAAATIYSVLWGKKVAVTKSKVIYSGGKALLVMLVFGSVSVLLWGLTSLNLIYAGMLGMVAAVFLVLLLRPDLWINVLFSGISFGLASLLILVLFAQLYPGVIGDWWHLEVLSGVLLMGVPVEEFLWHIGVGCVVGPLYELWRGGSNVSVDNL